MSFKATLTGHCETAAQELEAAQNFLDEARRFRSRGLQVTASFEGTHVELDENEFPVFKQQKEVHGEGGPPVGVPESGTPVPSPSKKDKAKS